MTTFISEETGIPSSRAELRVVNGSELSEPAKALLPKKPCLWFKATVISRDDICEFLVFATCAIDAAMLAVRKMFGEEDLAYFKVKVEREYK